MIRSYSNVISKMEQKQPFISCMKIKGIPILPPLVTPEKRKELEEYKKKAIILEKIYEMKLQNNSEMKHSKDSISDKRFVITESCLLNMGPEKKETDLKYVPYETRQKNVPLEDNTCKTYTTMFNTTESAFNEALLEETSGDSTHELSEDCPADTDKPRLIRSNSYTLETPSTILLDHLRRQSASSCEPTINLTKTKVGPKSPQRIKELDNAQNKPIGTKHQMDLNSDMCISNQDIVTEHISNRPSLEVITTDITVQQINFTTRNADFETSYSGDSNSIKNDDTSTTTDPEIELQAILQQIPEDYAKKIMMLIEEQRKEQFKRAQHYETIKTNMLQSGDFEERSLMETYSPQKIFVKSASSSQSNRVVNTPVNSEICRSESIDSHIIMRPKSVISSLNESQTLPLDLSATSSSESLDNFSLRTFRIVDNDDSASNIDISESSNEINQYFSEAVSAGQDDNDTNEDMKCLIENKNQKLREERAASIIGAYVKGYLVRRLMNTVKVKSIIQTIQEALVCALELQKSETIQEADVELHRKLIKLVSSACFEFHDIFFALSIPERMDIIAMDREKAKKTIAVRSTRSSTEIRKTGKTSTIRFTKSLTNI